MAQVLKETKAAKPALDNATSKVDTQVPAAKKAPEATVLNFDKTKSFNRYLEASCDCC